LNGNSTYRLKNSLAIENEVTVPVAEKSKKRRQIDGTLAAHLSIRNSPHFEKGFIYEFRDAIAMTRQQLASRLGISQQGVSKLELSEQSGTISLNSLRKVAEEFDCKLVYALVPNQSLTKLVEQKALSAAAAVLNQAKDDAGVIRLAKQMIVKGSPEIWDEPD